MSPRCFRLPRNSPITMSAVDLHKPTADMAIGELRGSLKHLEDHVAKLYHFGKQTPKGDKAVDGFYKLAVKATNRLQKSIGLPEGPITTTTLPPPPPPPPPPPAPAAPASAPASSPAV